MVDCTRPLHFKRADIKTIPNKLVPNGMHVSNNCRNFFLILHVFIFYYLEARQMKLMNPVKRGHHTGRMQIC